MCNAPALAGWRAEIFFRFFQFIFRFIHLVWIQQLDKHSVGVRQWNERSFLLCRYFMLIINMLIWANSMLSHVMNDKLPSCSSCIHILMATINFRIYFLRSNSSALHIENYFALIPVPFISISADLWICGRVKWNWRWHRKRIYRFMTHNKQQWWWPWWWWWLLVIDVAIWRNGKRTVSFKLCATSIHNTTVSTITITIKYATIRCYVMMSPYRYFYAQ